MFIRKKTKQKYIYALLIGSLVCMPLGTSHAWGHTLIRPGDHVIDLKRLADNIKITLQQALVYSQTLDQIQNMLKMNKKISLTSKISKALEVTNEKIAVSGLMKTINLDDLLSLKIDELPSFGGTAKLGIEAAEDTGEFTTSIFNETQELNSNVLTVNQHVLSNLNSHQTTISSILATETDSVRGEKQKLQAIESLTGLQEYESLKQKGADFIHSIEKEQLARQQEKFDEEVAVAKQNLGTMDPYHPTQYDDMLKKSLPIQTKPFGFPDL